MQYSKAMQNHKAAKNTSGSPPLLKQHNYASPGGVGKIFDIISMVRLSYIGIHYVQKV